MLQQTTVAVVEQYFEKFVRRWPRIEDLAAADLDEVLLAWEGLGYYARARNLHNCAQVVRDVHRGQFPQTENSLRQLPGVGGYTAAAIAAIAFARPASPVDGNIMRIIARLFAVETEMPRGRAAIQSLAQELTPAARPGDFAQALMDLGATICKPRRPDCGRCPLRAMCAATATGNPERYPIKAIKKPRPHLHGTAFWIADGQGAVLLRRRPKAGLLGGMMEIPSTEWRAQPWRLDELPDAAPVQTRWRPLRGTVSHGFTHFTLELSIVTGTTAATPAAGCIWWQVDNLDRQPLPTLMRKAVALALSSLALSGPGGRAPSDGDARGGQRDIPGLEAV